MKTKQYRRFQLFSMRKILSVALIGLAISSCEVNDDYEVVFEKEIISNSEASEILQNLAFLDVVDTNDQPNLRKSNSSKKLKEVKAFKDKQKKNSFFVAN